MEKLPEVETAKALMTEAVGWSVMKWLQEKKRVRKTADLANAALDQLHESVRARWTDGAKAAYEALAAEESRSSAPRKQEPAFDVQAKLVAKKIREAEEEATRARAEAEKTFDDAERQLSTALAREGCRKAILSWELKEKAIRSAEAAVEN